MSAPKLEFKICTKQYLAVRRRPQAFHTLQFSSRIMQKKTLV
jgi:hypothetical protein